MRNTRKVIDKEDTDSSCRMFGEREEMVAHFVVEYKKN